MILEMTETLAHISPHLKLRVSRRARRIALRLDNSTRHVALVVPVRYNIEKAEKFALEHKDWIRQKIAELPRPVAFRHGAVIPVLGRDREIVVIYDPALKTTSIRLTKNELRVKTNQRNPASRITRFLKQEARDTLTNLALEKAATINRKINSVQVRDTKSRWGSCSTGGRLSFSWRLIFAPWEALDYLVAHEVAHLIHMDHGKRFWALCEKLSDDYETGKSWITNHGHELMRYGGYIDPERTDTLRTGTH